MRRKDREITDIEEILQIVEGAKVLHLGGEFLLVLIDEHELVGDALQRQRIGDVRADVSLSDDADFSQFHERFLQWVCKIGCR